MSEKAVLNKIAITRWFSAKIILKDILYNKITIVLKIQYMRLSVYRITDHDTIH